MRAPIPHRARIAVPRIADPPIERQTPPITRTGGAGFYVRLRRLTTCATHGASGGAPYVAGQSSFRFVTWQHRADGAE
ncbi:MAG: hypothetical protein AAFR55_07875, partial [Pseudomonadota bacterium]